MTPPDRRRIVGDERGHLMVALLVAMSVMAVMMSVALPVWNTMARREKEAELVFRGEQYARAIALYQRRYANASPPSIDVLVSERFLRRKYKDPITNDEFQVVMAGAPIPGEQQPPGGSRGNPAAPGRGSVQSPAPPGATGVTPGAGGPGLTPIGGGTGRGGIVGVVSKSSERSFRLYNGRDTYNQWVFMGTQQSARAGGPPGAAAPGMPGGDGRGGRGVQQPPGRGGAPPGRGAPPGGPAQPPGQRGGFGSRNLEN